MAQVDIIHRWLIIEDVIISHAVTNVKSFGYAPQLPRQQRLLVVFK